MASSAGFLGFFILEASEYVEELDGLLAAGVADSSPPTGQAMQRIARALRGAATMARLTSFADVAAAMERIGRSLHQGTLRWNPALAGALIAAVDDLKTLLHSARSWSAADDERATQRVADLSRFAPVTRTPPSGAAAPARPPSAPYLATEAANIAAGLELLATRPADAAIAANVLRRVRALRGVAAVREIGVLADALEATEDAGRVLELNSEALSSEAMDLLGASASLLRHLASVLRDGGDAESPSPERDRFVAAQEQWTERHHEQERVVPIAELFFSEDSTGVVDAAQRPPTSLSERFRLELVSQGEHLRGVLGALRATDPATAARARRELRRALRSLQTTAASFGQADVAELIGVHAGNAEQLDSAALEMLDELATRLAHGGSDGVQRLVEQLRDLSRPATPPAPPPALAPPAAPAPPPAPAPPVEAEPASDSFLDAIDSGIAALDRLSSQPFSARVPVVAEDLVPVETLLYHGRAALGRAVEIRDQLRRVGPTSDPAALEELFDLLELARTE